MKTVKLSQPKENSHVNKWLSNKQINQKLSNHLWKNNHMPYTQIAQTLKVIYTQYMGNHRKNIFWPLKYQNPNCTLCQNNDRDTWPHLLSTCEHPYLKGLQITRHNKAIHLITQTLQANKHTRFFTLTNAGNLNNQCLDQTILEWFLACACPSMNMPMPSQIKTRHIVHYRSPQPNTNTYNIFPQIHSLIH